MRLVQKKILLYLLLLILGDVNYGNLKWGNLENGVKGGIFNYDIVK